MLSNFRHPDSCVCVLVFVCVTERDRGLIPPEKSLTRGNIVQFPPIKLILLFIYCNIHSLIISCYFCQESIWWVEKESADWTEMDTTSNKYQWILFSYKLKSVKKATARLCIYRITVTSVQPWDTAGKTPLKSCCNKQYSHPCSHHSILELLVLLLLYHTSLLLQDHSRHE